MHVHTTDKPYYCTVRGCDKTYTHPSSLRKHLKGHEMEAAGLAELSDDSPSPSPQASGGGGLPPPSAISPPVNHLTSSSSSSLNSTSTDLQLSDFKTSDTFRPFLSEEDVYKSPVGLGGVGGGGTAADWHYHGLYAYQPPPHLSPAPPKLTPSPFISNHLHQPY